jgi:hypothetical protein
MDQYERQSYHVFHDLQLLNFINLSNGSKDNKADISFSSESIADSDELEVEEKEVVEQSSLKKKKVVNR